MAAPCLEAMPVEQPSVRAVEPPTGPMLPETDELPAHPPPMPCLEPTPRDVQDEPADEGSPERADPGDSNEAQPHPCLSRPRPMPCLTPRRVEPVPMPCLSVSRVAPPTEPLPCLEKQVERHGDPE